MISALWVGFAALVFWERLTTPYTPTLVFTYNEEMSTPAVTEFGSPDFDMLKALKDAGRFEVVPLAGNDSAYISTADAIGTRADNLIAIQDARSGMRADIVSRRHRDNRVGFFQMALSVPLALLVAGGVVGWILRGFRGEASESAQGC